MLLDIGPPALPKEGDPFVGRRDGQAIAVFVVEATERSITYRRVDTGRATRSSTQTFLREFRRVER